MADNILRVEVKSDDGSITYVNPAHIVKVVNKNYKEFLVHLTNGDVFTVDYSAAQKIREYFDNAQKRLF